MKTQKRPRTSVKIASSTTQDQKSIKSQLEGKIPLEKRYRHYGLDSTEPEN